MVSAQRTRNPAEHRGFFAALAALILLAHFLSFDIAHQPIITDVRYYLYFAWQVRNGATPHVDLYDPKTQLATFIGALLYALGERIGVDPLHAIRAGYLAIAAFGGWLLFLVGRALFGCGAAAAGTLAYCAFGMIGSLCAVGNVPKLVMALCATAMGLACCAQRWFWAGLLAGLAFTDWQIGLLVGAAALVSAACLAPRRLHAGILLLIGFATALAPYAAYFALRGGLSEALEQTVVSAFFRGSFKLESEPLAVRLSKIRFQAEGSCGPQVALFYAGLLGLLPGVLLLARLRRSALSGLLLPLLIYHCGVVAFTLIDFQGKGDFFLLLHTAAFGLCIWFGLLHLGAEHLARNLSPRGRAAAAATSLLVLASLARPSILRPDISVAKLDHRRKIELRDQREVAEQLARRSAGARLLFLDSSELLFLMRARNPLPMIYWNAAAWSHYRLDAQESFAEAADRLVRTVDPDVLIYQRPFEHFRASTIASRNGSYEVVVQVRK
jgi:hypothetical protein